MSEGGANVTATCSMCC